MVLLRGHFSIFSIGSYLTPLEKPPNNYEKTAKNEILIVKTLFVTIEINKI